MNTKTQDIKSLLGQALTHKYLTRRFLQYIDESHISGLLSTMQRITLDGFAELLRQRLGYALNDRTRLRMVRVIMDLLNECNYLKKEDGFYILNEGNDPDMECSREEFAMVREMFEGQMNFFDQCIAHAEKFFRGASPLYSFDNDSIPVWEGFLGNMEFSFARSVLINLIFSGRSNKVQVLDLCYGPGFGILQMQESFPEIEVTALDFQDIFVEQASGRIPNPVSVQWINSGLWDGFGSPLPFKDNSFDVVFFACADPYIPAESRRYVYSDIFRILKNGGTLGVLSHSYPDAGMQYVKDPWVRRGVLCHDFFESVCKGWQGFYDAAGSIDLFKALGYRIDVIMLDASVWKIDKP
jgi:ubiquinone/menaquinone biosynthesis C-methylase UbiE